MGLHAIRDIIAPRRFKGERQRGFAPIQKRHMRRPRHGGGNTKATRMAKGIQHRGPFRKPCDTGAMFALVKEPTGLLPTQRINREGKPAFLHRNHASFAMQQLGFLGQSFQGAYGAVIARNHHAGRDQPMQRFQDQRCCCFHAGAIGLDGHRIAVAINHQAWQAIRFRMDQAIMRAVK